MNQPRAPLTRILTWLLMLLALAAAGTSIAMIVLTNRLQVAGDAASASLEAASMADDAERDVGLHLRAHTPPLRNQLAGDATERLGFLRSRATNEDERRHVDAAASAASTYFAAIDDADRAELAGHASDRLAELARVHRDREAIARAAERRAEAAIVILALTTALLVTVSTLVIAWWLNRRAFHPLRRIADAIHRFGGGDDSVRAPTDGPREIAEIAEGFNAMADALHEQHVAHETYLASVAHDLRGPLGTLSLAVDTVTKTSGASPQIVRVVGIVHRQLARLGRLVDDLLDTANLQAGRLDMILREHDVRDIARSVSALYAASSSTHEVVLSTSDEPAIVRCDAQRVEQVLANLVGNAIKYSPHGGRVDIAVATTADQVHIAVRDQGVGMNAAEVEAAFRPFARLETLRNSVPGHGLGLFVVSRIVEALGGTIDVKSEVGAGSLFTIALPRVQRELAQADADGAVRALAVH